MEEDINVKESDEESRGCISLTHSPYVGGNKMSSSLKDRLKRSRMHSSPLSRPSSSSFTTPVAPRSIPFANFNSSKEDSSLSVRQDSQNTMNEPCKNEAESALNIGSDFFICEKDSKVSNALVITETFQETSLEIGDNSSENPDVVLEHAKNTPITEVHQNIFDKPYGEIKEKASLNPIYSLKTDSEKANPNANQNLCLYSKEDIENAGDIEALHTMYSNLKKQSHEHEETLRKLKLVQQHHTKNNPDALNSLTTKWLRCTQLSLKRLYDLMPEPQKEEFYRKTRNR
ncbi:hypothetical protein JTE90_019336 [Oedothorax gibbosus]|uniref:Swi5-dependent recombination DNA repair protein 1 homolog n=1 Tax=Oedothorax gibbosus TaxID=931172 RepID=A0AAV6ULZ0_9ARAC|nr:hypothetical protein JTE90_019336 [Oedothorax gibbosus]